MKKVLIVTYYWPPAGGPGVQRILKFAKYLPDFGWTPLILTVNNGNYPAVDFSLEKEISPACVIKKTNIFEPIGLYKKAVGLRKDQGIPVGALTQNPKNVPQKCMQLIRLNCFIPDAKIGWLPFAVRGGTKIIQQERPHIVFSSSPPPTVHLIAKKLSQRFHIPWVADFRDPWLELAHYQKINRPKHAVARDAVLEKSVLTAADRVITVSNDIKTLLQKKQPKTKMHVIPNGYDTDDFLNLKTIKQPKWTLMYAGNLSKNRIPTVLLKVLAQLKKEQKDFDIQLMFVGNTCAELHAQIDHYDLTAQTTFLPYQPHQQVLELLQSAHALLLIIDDIPENSGFVTGKIFDYLGCKRPIIMIGPPAGNAAAIIENTQSGFVVDYADQEKMESILLKLYNNAPEIEQLRFSGKPFERKQLTQELVRIFENIDNENKK